MRSKLLTALLPAVLIAACEMDNDVARTGQLSVLLTDAADPRIESATAYISAIYIIRGGDSTGPRDTISTEQQIHDLLELQNGVTAALGTVVIPTGTYTQMRMVVDSATLTLRTGTTFSDGSGSRTLKVPSGMRTGIKVNFASPMEITPGQTILVVDFDVSQNFVFTGPEDAPTGVLFKPVLHATVEDIAGSISGTVTPPSARATLYAILNLDTVQTTFADSISGEYTLRFLPPGDYTVSAVGAGLNVTKTLTLRASQDTTGVNFP